MAYGWQVVATAVAWQINTIVAPNQLLQAAAMVQERFTAHRFCAANMASLALCELFPNGCTLDHRMTRILENLRLPMMVENSSFKIVTLTRDRLRALASEFPKFIHNL